MHVGAVSVTLGCFIDRVVPVQHRACSLSCYRRPRGGLCYPAKEILTVITWSSAQLTRPQRGAGPPPGAICIPDKTIHHPCCSAQFMVLLQTAWGSSEQLYMYASVMRALETCLVALKARLEGWRGINESIPEEELTPILQDRSNCGSCLEMSQQH